LSTHGTHFRYRKPSKLTLAVASSTVLAAGATAGAVTLWPSPVAAQQAIGARIMKSGASPSATPANFRIGPAIADLQARHSATEVADSLRAARRAARARAAAQARKAAARHAAELAAQQRAAAAAAPAAPAAPSADAAPAAPAPAAASGSAQQIADSMLGSYGWSSSQFSCLDDLWNRESGWNPTAENPSGAYGIPQALPGSKMASAGADWATNPATQIRWGLGYIKAQYGTPCGAWSHSEETGWY